LAKTNELLEFNEYFSKSNSEENLVNENKNENDIFKYINIKYLVIENSFKGDLESLKNLFNTYKFINVNDVDYDLRSPLHLACESGNYDIVKFLVEEKKAKINLKDR
jgi:ankyrin repeat protein